MNTDTSLMTELQRPGDYWHRHGKELPFRTFSALKRHLGRRRQNGLLEARAVIESPVGLLISPSRFGLWLMGTTPLNGRQGDATNIHRPAA